MNCMTCQIEMTTNPCACGGAWIPEAKLVEMAEHMKGSLVTLSWQPRAGGDHRICPYCAQEMLAVSLVGVELDRCAAHGVWFDSAELERVLASVAQLPGRGLSEPDVKLGHALLDDGSAPVRRSSSSVWWILGAIFEILEIIAD